MSMRIALFAGLIAATHVAAPAIAQTARRFAVIQTTASTEISAAATITSTQDLTFVISTTSIGSLGGTTLQSGGRKTSGTTASSSTGVQQLSGNLMPSMQAPARATFTVAGDAGQSISVSMPSDVDLTRTGGTETAQLTTDSSVSDGPQFLGGDFASSGTLSFDVGGQVTLASAQVLPGTYSGVLAVVAQYN